MHFSIIGNATKHSIRLIIALRETVSRNNFNNDQISKLTTAKKSTLFINI